MTPPTIRTVRATDVPAVRAIYNEAVRTTTATFHARERTEEEMQAWYRVYEGGRHPCVVAEQDGAVVAFAGLKPHSERCAYASTVAVEIYVLGTHRGRGIGRALLGEVLRRGEQAGFHTALALICGENSGSVRLHESFGFEQVGRTREVGVKFGRVLDVVYMQKMLAPLPEGLS